jgi:hypothetical protein
MEKRTIEQSRARIQGYIEKIYSMKKHAEDALVELIDFLKKSHELRKDLADVFISAAEDIKDDIDMTMQIQALLPDEAGTMEQDEEINTLISSLKEFSFTTKLKKSEIDSELAEKIEKVVKDFDEAFHEELDPILELIADEQRKIENMSEES